MSGLLLVAAGGLAREVLAVVRATTPDLDVRVLDDDAALWGGSIGDAPIVGGLEEVKRYDDHEVLVCAGRGGDRDRIVSRLAVLDVPEDRYAGVVHPSVDVPGSCTVGRGSILLAGVVLTADVTVGRHVVVMPNASLNHDVVVEDFATVCSGVSLGGHVQVGWGAYLGMNASVRQHVRVGAESTLGMGSALLRFLPPGETWVGVPARPLASRWSRTEAR